MSGACDRFLKELPLYAEGELAPRELRTIRTHLEVCAACRGFVAAYDDFTRNILEEESPEQALPGDDLAAEDEGSGESWEFRRRLGVPRSSRRPWDAAFTSRVMSDVRRAASRRKIHRIRRIAAAILVLSGLALGGLAWVGGRRLGTEVAARFPDASVPPLAAQRVLPVSTAGGLAAAPGPRQDLASSWWVIDPEREKEARETGSGRELEAVLYTRGLEGEGSAEVRDFVVLKALLGAARQSASGSSRPGGSDLLMVPESDGAQGALSLRPVALPIRVPEGDIAPNTRIRIRTPATRYRIIWIGSGGMPLLFSPVIRFGESRAPRPGFSLSPPPVEIPVTERY